MSTLNVWVNITGSARISLEIPDGWATMTAEERMDYVSTNAVVPDLCHECSGEFEIDDLSEISEDTLSEDDYNKIIDGAVEDSDDDDDE